MHGTISRETPLSYIRSVAEEASQRRSSIVSASVADSRFLLPASVLAFFDGRL